MFLKSKSGDPRQPWVTWNDSEVDNGDSLEMREGSGLGPQTALA